MNQIIFVVEFFRDLSHNRLIEIGRDSFKQLINLNRLDLNDNQITVILEGAFNSTSSLESLDLSNNDISSTIEDMMGGFSGLSLLQHLNLAGNQIKSINRLAFTGLHNLTSLDLDNNNITTIQANAFDRLTSLQDLVINTASLLCDCNLHWFANWLRDESKFLKIRAKCAYPHQLRGRQLIHLSQANFTCGHSPKPYLIQGPETKMTLKGDNVTLTCRAKSNSPNPMTFKWKRDNAEINRKATASERVAIQSDGTADGQTEAQSELVLYNVSHQDVGKYQCVVENDFGTTYSSKAHISVLSKYSKNDPESSSQI